MKSELLTETELEIMSLLWRLGEASVRQLLEALPADRKLAYTSVSTMVRILEQKGFVGARKEGRGHAYFPLVKKEAYETQSVDHLVKKVFDGEASTLVRRLIESRRLDEGDLRAIRELLGDEPKEGTNDDDDFDITRD